METLPFIYSRTMLWTMVLGSTSLFFSKTSLSSCLLHKSTCRFQDCPTFVGIGIRQERLLDNPHGDHLTDDITKLLSLFSMLNAYI